MTDEAELRELGATADRLAKEENWDELIAVCTRIIALDPQAAKIFNNHRGVAYDKKGEYDRAIADFDQAIELNPEFAEAFNNRGAAYDKKGEHDRAITDLDRAIELNPKSAEAFTNRGLAYGKKHEYDRAIADFDQAIALKPEYKDAIHNRAVALALRQSAAEQEKITEKYEEEFEQQQQDFKAQLEKYKTNILGTKEYREREEKYGKEKRNVSIFRWCLLGLLFTLAFVGYGCIALLVTKSLGVDVLPNFLPYTSQGEKTVWQAFSFFPLIILISLILSPLVWAIRWLGDDRNRLWALREDAYTNHILTLLINKPQSDETKDRLIMKLFEHHDNRSSAQLIANWNKSQHGSANPIEPVTLLRAPQDKKAD